MHTTAMNHGRLFFDTYTHALPHAKVVDIGSQDINGSLREVCPERFRYCGVDHASGQGVDIVLEDPYQLPFETASQDIVVCNSCFEHVEFFWLLFVEVIRILKPEGLFYLNAPSNGPVHRHPVDSWRFYPDAAYSLVAWATRSGYQPQVLESFTGHRGGDADKGHAWADFVAVMVRDKDFASKHACRMIERTGKFTNGLVQASTQFLQPADFSEDQAMLIELTQELQARNDDVAALRSLNDDLVRTLSEQQRSLQLLIQSRSWRLTSPLRWLRPRMRL